MDNRLVNFRSVSRKLGGSHITTKNRDRFPTLDQGTPLNDHYCLKKVGKQ